MNFDALLAPIVDFFSTGIGLVIRNIAEFLYDIFSPSNAEAAHPIEMPQ